MKKKCREKFHFLKVSYDDLITQCPIIPRSNCPKCKNMQFFGRGDDAFYLQRFRTLEDAILWKVSGHISPAEILVIEDNEIFSLMEQIEATRSRMESLHHIFERKEEGLTRQLVAKLQSA